MATGYCRECGSQVSNSAKFCPQCGVRHPTASNPIEALNSPDKNSQSMSPFARFAIRVLLVFVVLGVIGTAIQNHDSSAPNNLTTAAKDAVSPQKIVQTPIAKPPSHARLRPTEPFEGIWAKTKDECLDEEGPNSRTLIDLGNVVRGQATPIFDQYENHCLVDRKSTLGEKTTLAVTCFESWEDFTERREGNKTSVKLSAAKGNFEIDGEEYQRCEAPPPQSNVADGSQTKVVRITSLSAYTNQIKHKWV